MAVPLHRQPRKKVRRSSLSLSLLNSSSKWLQAVIVTLIRKKAQVPAASLRSINRRWPRETRTRIRRKVETTAKRREARTTQIKKKVKMRIANKSKWKRSSRHQVVLRH
jgi:hypothetical protein